LFTKKSKYQSLQSTEFVLDTRKKKKYTQIRVKSLEFMDSSAIAVYFYDMTHHVEQIRLESEIIERENRHLALLNFQMVTTLEFKTPLTTSLMFLESLLREELQSQARSMLNIITSQLNFLLCLVNDILDF